MRPISYTDISALKSLDRESPEALQAVAKQFESMFVDMMLQAAHSATAVLAEGNPLRSDATDLHEEMLNHQLAMDMSEHGGIGLAPLLVRQLSKLVPGAHSVRDTGAVQAPIHEIALPRRALPLHSATDVLKRLQLQQGDAAPPAALPRPVSQRAPREPAAVAKQPAFASPVEFVRAILPAIEQATAGTPISPIAVLAQAALETGWGKAMIHDNGQSSSNLFGIKAGASWNGATATVSTLEFREGLPAVQRAAFRVYDDVAHAVRDFMSTLQGSPRYADALSSAASPEAYAREIGRSGYATDPDYTGKLLRILKSPTLSSALQQIAAERQTAQHASSPNKSAGGH